MSEELQGAAPQAGKTKVSVLKEGFEGASIPTEETKPEATEERKEVAVKSEDIPSPLQNATQLCENVSNDVSQTKGMHPSSSAHETSLNFDPKKMAASPCLLDSVKEQCEENQGTASQTGVPEELVVKKTTTEGHKRAAAKSEVKLPILHQDGQLAFKDNVGDEPLSIKEISSPLDSSPNFNPANRVECPEKVVSLSPHLFSSTSHTQETDLKMCEKDEKAAIHVGGRTMRPLQQPIWKQNSSVISQPSLDLTSTDSSDLTKLSEIFNELPEDNKVRTEVLKHSMEKMYQGLNADLRIFYCIATQLYRLKQSTSLCPLCLYEKKDRMNKRKKAHPDSHIFPSCILEEYKNIHCKTWEDEFIYDQISRNYKGFSSLTYPIFCQVCESNASIEESVLKDVYLKITGTTNQSRTCHVSHKDYLTVKHMLAVILFRGMLLGVNFLEELKINKDFFDIFEPLRRFCSSSEYESHWVLSKFHVYTVDNKHYNLNSQDPKYKYSMELQLRNPQYTKMVRTSEGDVFLYTKIDCFHCVLPIKSTTIKFPRQEGFHNFPLFLWKYNLQEVGNFTSQWNLLERRPGAFIQDPLDQSLPELPPSIEVIPVVGDQIKKAENIVEKHSVLRKSARSQSPLAMVNSRDRDFSNLEKEVEEEKYEKKLIQSQVDQQKQKDKKLRSKMEKRHEQSEKKSQEKIKNLSSRNRELEEKSSVLQQDKDELQQELQQLKLNPLPSSMDKADLVDDHSSPIEYDLTQSHAF